DLLAALGVSATYVGKTQFDHLVVVDEAEVVRSLSPDFRKLKSFSTRGVMVTSHSDDGRFDFVSRFFAPAVGIDEDPVTGSAHCCLGPYWADVLGKPEMTAFQASARGGVVQVRILGARVVLGGQAVTIWQGQLLAVSESCSHPSCQTSEYCRMPPSPSNLAEKLSLFTEQWWAKSIAWYEDFHLRLATLEGDFVCHSHPESVDA